MNTKQVVCIFLTLCHHLPEKENHFDLTPDVGPISAKELLKSDHIWIQAWRVLSVHGVVVRGMWDHIWIQAWRVLSIHGVVVRGMWGFVTDIYPERAVEADLGEFFAWARKNEWMNEQIVASELNDPIYHSNDCQIESFSSEATRCMNEWMTWTLRYMFPHSHAPGSYPETADIIIEWHWSPSEESTSDIGHINKFLKAPCPRSLVRVLSQGPLLGQIWDGIKVMRSQGKSINFSLQSNS